MNKIVLVDFSNLAFRALHSHIDLTTSKGIGSGMAYGMIQNLLYLFIKYKLSPKQVILVKDGRPQWKYDLFPEYKAHRKKVKLPEEKSVSIQMKITLLLLSYMGLTWAVNKEEECDDVIMTISKHFSNKGGEVVIIGNDHDFYQCLNGNVEIMHLHKQGEELITEDSFVLRYHIFPDEYWKVQNLGGCSTDKVPGMLGVGGWTAAEMVAINTWDRIIKNDKELQFPNKRTQTVFKKNFDKWEIHRDQELVTLKPTIKFETNKNQFNKDKLREWFVRLEFKNYLLPEHFQRICEVFGGEG